MSGVLRGPLSAEQADLLRVIFEPFDSSGVWPLWQYVDLTLDQRGIDAAGVLASLPAAGDPGPVSRRYGLVWRQDMHMDPQPDSRVRLTVAGLQHVSGSGPLLGAFLGAVCFLAHRQRHLEPSPFEVVEATASDEEIGRHLVTGGSGAMTSLDMRKLRAVIGGEPLFYGRVQQPQPDGEWSVLVPAELRAYRDLGSVDDYVGRVAEGLAPSGPPPVPFRAGPLEIPYAVDYLDAVWKSSTGSSLFVHLSPASVGRLTQPCGNEEEFGSLMSALADVLGQVVAPGTARPRQRGALEVIGDYLGQSLDGDAAARAGAAVETLIRLRQIRVSGQHRDARYKAVAAFESIGVTFPPGSWDTAWERVVTVAVGALDTLREEIRAGLPPGA